MNQVSSWQHNHRKGNYFKWRNHFSFPRTLVARGLKEEKQIILQGFQSSKMTRALATHSETMQSLQQEKAKEGSCWLQRLGILWPGQNDTDRRRKRFGKALASWRWAESIQMKLWYFLKHFSWALYTEKTYHWQRPCLNQVYGRKWPRRVKNILLSQRVSKLAEVTWVISEELRSPLEEASMGLKWDDFTPYKHQNCNCLKYFKC